MKKLLALSLVAIGIVWAQGGTSVDSLFRFGDATAMYHIAFTLASDRDTAEQPFKLSLDGTGYLVIYRDDNEVLRIYSDEEGIQTICKGCSNVQRLPNGLGMSRPVGFSIETDCKNDQCLGWDNSSVPSIQWAPEKVHERMMKNPAYRAGYLSEKTTGATWATTKGDPSTAIINLELLEEKK